MVMEEATAAAKTTLAAVAMANKEAKVAAIPGTKAAANPKATSAGAMLGVVTLAVEAGAATLAGATTPAMAAVANKEATVVNNKLAAKEAMEAAPVVVVEAAATVELPEVAAKLPGVAAAVLVLCGATQAPVTGPRPIR